MHKLKLISMIVSLVLATLALITVAFAWFAMLQNAGTDDIITTPKDFDVSYILEYWDENKWTEVRTKIEISSAIPDSRFYFRLRISDAERDGSFQAWITGASSFLAYDGVEDGKPYYIWNGENHFLAEGTYRWDAVKNTFLPEHPVGEVFSLYQLYIGAIQEQEFIPPIDLVDPQPLHAGLGVGYQFLKGEEFELLFALEFDSLKSVHPETGNSNWYLQQILEISSISLFIE